MEYFAKLMWPNEPIPGCVRFPECAQGMSIFLYTNKTVRHVHDNECSNHDQQEQDTEYNAVPLPA